MTALLLALPLGAAATSLADVEDSDFSRLRDVAHSVIAETIPHCEDDSFWSDVLRQQADKSERGAAGAWRGYAATLHPTISKEDLTMVLRAKRGAVWSAHARARVYWWDDQDETQSSPKSGVVIEHWWTPTCQVLTSMFVDPHSGAVRRADEFEADGVIYETTRVDALGKPEVQVSRRIGHLEAESSPIMQLGILDAGFPDLEGRGPSCLLDLLAEPTTVVLGQTSVIMGRRCIVLMAGTGVPGTRAFLSIEDDFMPVRLESFVFVRGDANSIVGRRLRGVVQVCDTFKIERGWPVPKVIASAVYEAGGLTDSPHYRSLRLIVGETAKVNDVLPSPLELMAVTQGTTVVDSDLGTAFRVDDRGPNLNAAIDFDLARLGAPEGPWSARLADVGLGGGILLLTAVLVVARARRSNS